MAMCAAPPRVYDHRVRELVCATGDPNLFPDLAIPRSTAAGWLREGAREVVTAEVFTKADDDLRIENIKLRRRLAVQTAVLRLVLAVLRAFDVRLDGNRLPAAASKARILNAVRIASSTMPVVAALRVLRLSPSRYYAWKRAEQCGLDDRSSCPHLSPSRLTRDEVDLIEEMVTSEDYRHVPLSRLAVVAQRLGKVYASATTWCKLVREHGWRRPRHRLYPDKPKVGVKATAPNQYWHLDVTVIKLLDGTKVYLHGVIDNFSRRLLAWKLATTLCPSSTCHVLLEAGKAIVGGATPPMVVTDSGVENVNKEVDSLQDRGIIKRILALVEVDYSNSKIEAFWRSLRHQWLY
jgi:transposase InsO family protein